MRIDREYDWIKTVFVNFDPEIEKKYLYIILCPLREFAPSQSIFLLKIYKKGDLFKGILDVRSASHQFHCACYDRGIFELVNKLKKEMTWKIENWKQTRIFGYENVI